MLEEVASMLPELRDEFGVTRLALFGSVARGEAHADSDIDLLVEFETPVSLFTFLRLKHRLEDRLGRSIDLVEPDAVHPALRTRVLSEAVDAA